MKISNFGFLVASLAVPAMLLGACSSKESPASLGLSTPSTGIATVDFQSPLLGPITRATSINKFEVVDALADSFDVYGAIHAIQLNNIGQLTFVGQGEFIEYADGRARLTGLAQLANSPAKQFKVDVRYVARNKTQVAKRELKAEAYKENGGPVDTSTFSYYKLEAGILEGTGDLTGLSVSLTQRGPQFQLGLGANGKNVHLGASGWLDYKLSGSPAAAANWPRSGEGDINVDLNQFYCAEGAEADVRYANPSYAGHAYWAPDFAWGSQDEANQFVFAEPAKFIENADGTARLTGKLVRVSNVDESLQVELKLAGRVDNITADDIMNEYQNYTPDAAKIHVYGSSEGTLTGGGALTGLRVKLTRKGHPFAVGDAANAKNLRYGAAGWFNYEVVTQPSAVRMAIPVTGGADFNLNLRTCNYLCVADAVGDARYTNVANGSHAFSLPGLVGEGKSKFVLTQQGRFIEYGDGTARLTGIIRDADDDQKRFWVDMNFSDRTHVAPPGSPKKELSSSAYTIVDPALWHYYKKFTGTLTGQADYVGARVTLMDTEPKSPVMQIGLGANGKNLNYGLSGWLTFMVEAQPLNSLMKFFRICNDGDINVDLPVCTEVCKPEQTTGIVSDIE